jgi:hypothetical protein
LLLLLLLLPPPMLLLLLMLLLLFLLLLLLLLVFLVPLQYRMRKSNLVPFCRQNIKNKIKCWTDNQHLRMWLGPYCIQRQA